MTFRLKSRSISLSSRSFPLLRVASSILARSTGKRRLLLRVEPLYSRNCQLQELVELRAVERAVLASALHFHEPARRAHHDIHVDLGAHILRVVEIQSRLSVDDSDADRSDTSLNRSRSNLPRFHHPVERLLDRYGGAGYRGRACSAVGDQNVAVDLDREFAELEIVQHGTHAAADQTLNFLSSPAELRSLARGASARCARKHCVLSGKPSLAAAPAPTRDAVFNACGTKHPGGSESDQTRAFGIRSNAGLQSDGAHIGILPVTPRRALIGHLASRLWMRWTGLV